MQTVHQIINLARDILTEAILQANGSVLYTSAKTLCAGDLYILGVNTSGDSDVFARNTVNSHIDELPGSDVNEYLDTNWGKKGPGNEK